jgi:hypothetical protein
MEFEYLSFDAPQFWIAFEFAIKFAHAGSTNLRLKGLSSELGLSLFLGCGGAVCTSDIGVSLFLVLDHSCLSFIPRLLDGIKVISYKSVSIRPNPVDRERTHGRWQALQ